MSSLNAAAIIAEAEAKAGFPDPEPQLFRNLEALTVSLNRDGRFGPEGWEATHKALLRVTNDRLTAHKWLRDFPEIADEQIIDPVFLCGLPRSGTTYFQYLFDREPSLRMMRTWEGDSPCPPPAVDPASAKARRDQCADQHRQRREQAQPVEFQKPDQRDRVKHAPPRRGAPPCSGPNLAPSRQQAPAARSPWARPSPCRPVPKSNWRCW